MAVKKSTSELDKKAAEILEKAKELGTEQSFMFLTTFSRYQELIAHAAELQKAIQTEGTLVEKEYVKGRRNLYVNPAVNAYNQTVAQANNTAKLLFQYILQQTKGNNEGGDEFDVF